MKNSPKPMVQPNFWQGETCEYCGGEITEKRVALTHKVKGQYVLIENIPSMDGMYKIWDALL